MKRHIKWLAAAIVGSLAIIGSVQAATEITNFADFFPNFGNGNTGPYCMWSEAAISHSPTGYVVTVSSIDPSQCDNGAFGGVGNDWSTPFDLSADTNIELTCNITVEGPALVGPVVVLQDAYGEWQGFAWYGLFASGPNSYVLTHTLSRFDSTGAAEGSVASTWGPTNLDWKHIVHMDIQVDQGTATGAYSIDWQNVRATGPGDVSPPPRSPVELVYFGGFVPTSYDTASWTSSEAVEGETNWSITANSGGSITRTLFTPFTITGAGLTNLQLNMSISGLPASGEDINPYHRHPRGFEKKVLGWRFGPVTRQG